MEMKNPFSVSVSLFFSCFLFFLPNKQHKLSVNLFLANLKIDIEFTVRFSIAFFPVFRLCNKLQEDTLTREAKNKGGGKVTERGRWGKLQSHTGSVLGPMREIAIANAQRPLE